MHSGGNGKMIEAVLVANTITGGGVGSMLIVLLLVAVAVIWLICHYAKKGGEWMEEQSMPEEQKREKAARKERRKKREEAADAAADAAWNESKAIIAKKTSRLLRAVGNAGAAHVREFMDKHAPEDETARRDDTTIADNNGKQTNGETPLHWAARVDNTKNLLAVINTGWNLHARDNDGKTALDIAIEKHGKDSETVRILQEAIEKKGGK